MLFYEVYPFAYGLSYSRLIDKINRNNNLSQFLHLIPQQRQKKIKELYCARSKHLNFLIYNNTLINTNYIAKFSFATANVNKVSVKKGLR